ncbi:MAG TPA: hypothetical protein ENJ08_13750 [Gammaproteobacteria bacterium]|nr:hypothetical protein [Gammaproteobacteria bacterium]
MHELKKFDEVHEEAGGELVKYLKKHKNTNKNLDARIYCPKDIDVVMMRRFYSPKNSIEIDECPQCGGIWLDTGELEKIRTLFPNQSNLDACKKEFVDKVMDSDQSKKLEKDSLALIEKMENITNFLCSIVPFSKKQ